MPRLLELFKGTGSVGRAFEALGWDVTSLDIDPKANATYTCDIADFDYRCIDVHVDVIWASPNCTKYSVCRTLGLEDDLQSSDALVRKTLEIAEALGSPPFFCENPYTGQLKNRGIIELPMQKVDYCVMAFPIASARPYGPTPIGCLLDVFANTIAGQALAESILLGPRKVLLGHALPKANSTEYRRSSAMKSRRTATLSCWPQVWVSDWCERSELAEGIRGGSGVSPEPRRILS